MTTRFQHRLKRLNTSLLALCVLLGLSSCSTTRSTETTALHAAYPAHWWTAVDRTKAPSWEIFPDEAKPGEVILSKRNELGILSNFAATPFTLHGKHYASVEGFWQMMLYPEGSARVKNGAQGKALDPRFDPRVKWAYTREQVAQMVAFEAKRAGGFAEANLRKLGIDWVSFEGERFPYRSMNKGRHYQLIREAMQAKLDQNAKVREVLCSTGDLKLRPDHHGEKTAPPEWEYYTIWMEMRSAQCPRH